MTLTRTYQNELKSWLASFHSDAGLPKKAVTLTIPEQKLIIQYEIRGEMPNIGKMRQAGKELAIASGTGAMVAGGIIRKPIVFKDENTGRLKRRSEVSKNELMRRMLQVCQQNRLEYRYVLADSWFSSKENLSFIHQGLGKEFIIALKSNRTAALSYEAKLQGGFHRIDTLDLPEGQPVRGWLRGLDFPVLLLRQVFKNRDGSAGTLYLAGSDLDGEGETIKAIYQKRWKVETFHKTLKGNAALAKSPAKTVRTQSNHCFMAIYSACRLEWISATHQMNHFALRTRIYLKAVRYAFDELQLLKAA